MRLMSDRWLLLYNAFNFCVFFMDLSLGQGVLIPRVPIGRWLFFPRGHAFRRAIFRDIDFFAKVLAGYACALSALWPRVQRCLIVVQCDGLLYSGSGAFA